MVHDVNLCCFTRQSECLHRLKSSHFVCWEHSCRWCVFGCQTYWLHVAIECSAYHKVHHIFLGLDYTSKHWTWLDHGWCETAMGGALTTNVATCFSFNSPVMWWLTKKNFPTPVSPSRIRLNSGMMSCWCHDIGSMTIWYLFRSKRRQNCSTATTTTKASHSCYHGTNNWTYHFCWYQRDYLKFVVSAKTGSFLDVLRFSLFIFQEKNLAPLAFSLNFTQVTNGCSIDTPNFHLSHTKNEACMQATNLTAEFSQTKKKSIASASKNALTALDCWEISHTVTAWCMWELAYCRWLVAKTSLMFFEMAWENHCTNSYCTIQHCTSLNYKYQ